MDDLPLESTTDKLVFDPWDYFDGLLTDIDSAQFEIIFETYIFSLDEVGNAFVKSLKQASKRGVSVRLLIDGVGSYNYTTRLVKMFESTRCEIKIFHPLPWDFRVFRKALIAGQSYSALLSSIATINRRNHRKLCIIDRKTAWLGSFNITADHFNRLRNEEGRTWHDTGLRTSGSAVPMLLDNFEQVWQRKGENRTKRTRQFLAFSTIRGRKQLASELIDHLSAASERISITNAYFNPSNRVLKTLRRAAKKGVEVRVIVPAKSDIFFFPELSRTYYADLLNADIRVFEYQHSVLHSKTMLIDKTVVVGSTNLNFRSFIHDLELDALVFDKKIVEQMEQRFEQDLAQCEEIDLKRWEKYPLLLRLLAWVPRLLRYWM